MNFTKFSDEVLRTEIVGFRNDLVEYLIAENPEDVHAPIEVILKQRETSIGKLRLGYEGVQYLPMMELYGSRTKDGRGEIVENL